MSFRFRCGAFALLFLAGCNFAPAGLDDERAAVRAAGTAYDAPFEERVLAPLSAAPTTDEIVRRALAADNELEALWHEWRAALRAVDVESAYPATDVELDLQRSFSSGASGFDAIGGSIRFDPEVPWPSKVSARGRLALSRARVAGERFRARALERRAEVLESWSRLALLEEALTLRSEAQSIAALQARAAGAAIGAGAQHDLIRIQLEERTLADRVARARSDLEVERARLDALLARPVGDRPIVASAPPRPLAFDDSELFARLAERNPELRSLAHEVEGRSDALEIAKLRYFPDISPLLGFTGTVGQTLGLAFSAPLHTGAIQAGIDEARAYLEAAEAHARDAGLTLAAQLTAQLALLRDADRARALFESEIVPLATRLAANTRTSYAANAAPQRDWLEAARAELDARLLLSESRAAREIALARIEALTGVGIEIVEPGTEVRP